MVDKADTRRLALLVPAYDCQTELAATIGGLPDEEPLHVLIVDDGSRPPLIAPACNAIHQVRILRNETNLGIHGALRRGMEVLHAEGFRYAARLDAGDFALPGRFRLQATFLDDHPEVAIVGSSFELVDQEERLLRTAHMPTADAEIRRFKLLRHGLSHPSVMLRVDAVVEVGNYRDAYPCAEDLDLFLRLMQLYSVANLREVLTRKVEHAKSITVRRRRQMILSTIRLQLRYFRAACWADWAGLAKSVSQLLVSRSLFERLKLRYVRGATVAHEMRPSARGG